METWKSASANDLNLYAKISILMGEDSRLLDFLFSKESAKLRYPSLTPPCVVDGISLIKSKQFENAGKVDDLRLVSVWKLKKMLHRQKRLEVIFQTT